MHVIERHCLHLKPRGQIQQVCLNPAEIDHIARRHGQTTGAHLALVLAVASGGYRVLWQVVLAKDHVGVGHFGVREHQHQRRDVRLAGQ